MTAPTAPTADTPAIDNDEEQEPLYEHVESWVEGYFAPMFLHRVSDGTRARWCTRWWDHAEAIGRLTLLWSLWEAVRWEREPSAKAGWWAELDRHLPILLGVDGPFRSCRPAHAGRAAKHEVVEPPATEPAPPDYWD